MGLGLDCTCQALPFHRSISVELSESPTARQFDGESHHTPNSSLYLPRPFVLGVTRQRVPSQFSMSVDACVSSAKRVPTAMQSLALGQATPERTLDWPGRTGVAAITQPVPLRVSANVLVAIAPTATHAPAWHATACSDPTPTVG